MKKKIQFKIPQSCQQGFRRIFFSISRVVEATDENWQIQNRIVFYIHFGFRDANHYFMKQSNTQFNSKNQIIDRRIRVKKKIK